MAKKEPDQQPVVVTTEAPHKGVFFGYLKGEYNWSGKITLQKARMCVLWTQEVRSVFGLASTGPSKSCRISPAVPSVLLHGVEAVIKITVEAAAKFEEAPWN